MNAIFIDCRPEVRELLTGEIMDLVPSLEINLGQPVAEEIPALLDGRAAALVYQTALPERVLAASPELRLVVFLSTGASSYIDFDVARRLGVRVRNVASYGDRTVAEHALALMLAAARDLAAMDRGVRAGEWRPRDGVELAGKTLGLVGLGGVGRALAGIAAPFGMRVIGWNRSGVPAGLACEAVGLDELLARADVVSLHLALNDETRGLIDRRRLGLMRSNAILVNTARGALVDEVALAEALEARKLRHAALDVFGEEPLAAEHPLARTARTTLSAHVAYRTPEATTRLLRLGLGILRDELAALEAG
ncbi:MAG: 2-hydroxyacid dehydrogenase [Alphaproteobacteria bacterium]